MEWVFIWLVMNNISPTSRTIGTTIKLCKLIPSPTSNPTWIRITRSKRMKKFRINWPKLLGRGCLSLPSFSCGCRKLGFVDFCELLSWSKESLGLLKISSMVSKVTPVDLVNNSKRESRNSLLTRENWLSSLIEFDLLSSEKYW